MKTFHEWLENAHPECLIDEGLIDSLGKSKFVRNAVAAAGLAAGGIAGVEAHRTAYEPHNSAFPSVRQAAFDRRVADEDAAEASRRASKDSFLQRAIGKFERGEETSTEERIALRRSGYLDGKMIDHLGRKVTPDPDSQAAIAKRMGKTLVYPTRGERLDGNANFPDVRTLPFEED